MEDSKNNLIKSLFALYSNQNFFFFQNNTCLVSVDLPVLLASHSQHLAAKTDTPIV